MVDAEERLLGTVTDGDVRRGLLKKHDLEAPVTAIMNRNPVVANQVDSREHMLALLRARDIEQLPILDQERRPVGLETVRELSCPRIRHNRVVIMAGGLGSRLGALTEDCPKPMLPVGSKPILEVILESFIEYGFRRFYFSVNYRKEQIQDYFHDGSHWGVAIEYLEETEKLGTAGSLAMLSDTGGLPFFVMNGDLLTRINFHRILDFHNKHKARATLCVRRVEQTIPFGVVAMDDHRLLEIEEKPVRKYFVNAGIYLLEPTVLPLIPAKTRFDMPDLFRKIVEKGDETVAFPFVDYWLDIGRMGDFRQACQDYPEVFQ